MGQDLKPAITQEELERGLDIARRIQGYYQKKMVGQSWLGFSLLVSLVSNGHMLLESVPGLAKTTAARTMQEAVDGTFSRVQCTPDMLPSDIVGTQIFNMNTNSFETKLGPVHANFVLLDEINRSSAKTQSAMLEAMQERETSIGGTTYKLPDVFIVIATQNPIEQEGTYMLSEAQLDRFLLKEKLDYPNAMEEVEVLNRIESHVMEAKEKVATIDEVRYLQSLQDRVYMDPAIKRYIVDLVQATRNAAKYISPELSQYVALGASTRACIAFMEVAKSIALLNGRNYCTPDDVKTLRHSILRHRISLNYSAVADGVSVETIIDAIVGAVKTP